MSTRTDPQPAAVCAATLAVLLSGCAEVQPTERYAQVQNAVGARLEQNLFWNRDSDEDQRAREAVHRLLDQELTAPRAVQIALLNNRNLQAKLERLGIAQADLIDAGLLENPVLGLTLYSGNAGTIVEASLVQDFVGVISLLAGIIVLASPFASIVTLAIVVGVWFVVIGVFEIVSSFGMRKASRTLGG